jgi:hypothetical protein
VKNFLSIFSDLEPLDFSWMQTADRDDIVFFGCMIAAGIALAFGV